LIETALNRLLGRVRPPGPPPAGPLGTRASIVVESCSPSPTAGCDRLLAIAGAVSFGGFYTPGIALVSDRAEMPRLRRGSRSAS
jgi:hypothetical protein